MHRGRGPSWRSSSSRLGLVWIGQGTGADQGQRLHGRRPVLGVGRRRLRRRRARRSAGVEIRSRRARRAEPALPGRLVAAGGDVVAEPDERQAQQRRSRRAGARRSRRRPSAGSRGRRRDRPSTSRRGAPARPAARRTGAARRGRSACAVRSTWWIAIRRSLKKRTAARVAVVAIVAEDLDARGSRGRPAGMAGS